MPVINYFKEAEKYRPDKIKTLLVGEAPPSSKETYFYLPRPISSACPIEADTSLPATIFNHYFSKRPETENEYISFLRQLQERGIFLIDICSDPIKVRNCPEGIQRVIDEIPNLRRKMIKRKIRVQDQDIIFLLARNNYVQYIRRAFPAAKRIRWKDFRMSHDL